MGAARAMAPVLVALPLAAVGAVWFAEGPPPANALPEWSVTALEATGLKATPLPDTVSAQFGPCSGSVRTTCVVDGDTIWLNGDKIRIADINTPETSEPGCAYEAQLGAQATARLTQLLNQGAFAVAPNPDGRDEDQYGRKLRVLTRGGESLGDTLVAEGLAEEWQGYRREWC